MKEYAHYSNYPSNKWRWPDFRPIELRSKSDNKLAVDEDSMDKLQQLRSLLDKPMKLTSAYRSPAHNKKVGGAKHSKHLLATAFDVQMEGHDPAQFEAAAREVGFLGFGFYEKSNFMHIDTGPSREWGNRWFAKAEKYIHKNRIIPDMAQMDEEAVGGGNKVAAPAAVATGLVAAVYLLRDTFAEFFAGIQGFFGGLF